MKDYSGFRLEDAMEQLKAQGYEITVRLTASPRQRDMGYGTDSRVVRQRLLDNRTVELLVCNVNS
ncbi:MAG TPA: hypothetical protein PLP87_00215 [Clostridiales bacterium]|nr:hypothetical protein [Clostridiales bacterium]